MKICFEKRVGRHLVLFDYAKCNRQYWVILTSSLLIISVPM